MNANVIIQTTGSRYSTTKHDMLRKDIISEKWKLKRHDEQSERTFRHKCEAVEYLHRLYGYPIQVHKEI